MRTRLAFIARAVLLAISLFAAATAWVYAARPQWLDALDGAIVAWHTSGAEAALALAQRPGATAPEVIATLQPLLAELADVRKGDRLASVKRAAFARLAHSQLAGGDAASALGTAAAWRAFDALDLDAMLLEHDALVVLPGRHPEAVQRAGELFALAPGSQRFFVPYQRACLSGRDPLAAAQAFFAHLRAGGTPVGGALDAGFVLRRDDGAGFDPVEREPLAVHREGDTLRLTFSPPLGARRLRLELPPRAVGRLGEVRFDVTTRESAAVVRLRDLARLSGSAISPHGVHLEGDALVFSGHDEPSLLWGLGPGARLDTTWTLVCRVEPAPVPAWLGEVLALEAAGTLGRALLASAAVEDARAQVRYTTARRALLAAATVSVQVGEEPPRQIALTAGSEGDLMFRFAVERAGHRALRITLPPVAGIEVDLRAPFAAASRLLPASTVRASGGILRGDPPSALLAFALEPSDPGTFELAGRLW